MKSRHQIVQFTASFSLVLSSVLMASHAAAAPTWDIASDSTWRDVTNTAGTAHLVSKVGAGSLHAVCTVEQCAIFVQPNTGCIPGTSYPLLVNSARRVGIIPSRCLLVAYDGKPSLMVHLRQSKSLLSAMLSEQDLSIGFPTQGGRVTEFPIQMSGVSKLLASAFERLGKSAAKAGTPGSAKSGSRQAKRQPGRPNRDLRRRYDV